MGKQGDLLLIFADALARSWKQVTKFRPAGSIAAPLLAGGMPAASMGKRGTGKNDAMQQEQDALDRAGDAALEAAGFVRDERGLRFVKESDD